MRTVDEYQRAAAVLWHSAIVPFQRHPLHCTPAAPCVSWPAFKRALAAPYRGALQAAGGRDAALDPLAGLLIDAQCGCVTQTRWLQFATYFASTAWPRAALWPPLDLAAAHAVLQQPWFHGPISFDETVSALLTAQQQMQVQVQQQSLASSVGGAQTPSPPLSLSLSPSTPAGGGATFLVRYSETCWECNFWTLSFTTSRGVKSVRVAHHRAHEPTVALYVPGSSGSGTGAPVLACVPFRCSADGVDAATGALRTRFARHGAAGARVPLAEAALVGTDFYYILVPRPPGLLTVVYASLAELLACKYAAYTPAPRRRTHTDDPFAFDCPGDSPDCPP